MSAIKLDIYNHYEESIGHAFNVCTIHGKKFALIHTDKWSDKTLHLNLEGYTAIFLTAVHVSSDIDIKADRLIFFGDVISSQGHVKIRSSQSQLIKIASRIDGEVKGRLSDINLSTERKEKVLEVFKEGDKNQNPETIKEALVDLFAAIKECDDDGYTSEGDDWADEDEAYRFFNIPYTSRSGSAPARIQSAPA